MVNYTFGGAHEFAEGPWNGSVWRREMNYPNRSRLVLVLVVVGACSVWLAGDRKKNDGTDYRELGNQNGIVASGTGPHALKPVHQSLGVETRSRLSPVFGN
jgi:hypothetical protein